VARYTRKNTAVLSALSAAGFGGKGSGSTAERVSYALDSLTRDVERLAGQVNAKDAELGRRDQTVGELRIINEQLRDRLSLADAERERQAAVLAQVTRERNALRDGDIGGHPAFQTIRNDRDELRDTLDHYSRSIRDALRKHNLNNEGLTLDGAVHDALDTLCNRAKRAEREPSSTVWTQADHDRLIAELAKHGTNARASFESLVHLVAQTMDRLADERQRAKRRATAIAADRDRALRLATSKDRVIDTLRADADRRSKTLREIRQVVGNPSPASANLADAVRVVVKELTEQRDAAQTALVELQTRIRDLVGEARGLVNGNAESDPTLSTDESWDD
jgi:chromosome segregation ATPase